MPSTTARRHIGPASSQTQTRRHKRTRVADAQVALANRLLGLCAYRQEPIADKYERIAKHVLCHPTNQTLHMQQPMTASTWRARGRDVVRLVTEAVIEPRNRNTNTQIGGGGRPTLQQLRRRSIEQLDAKTSI